MITKDEITQKMYVTGNAIIARFMGAELEREPGMYTHGVRMTATWDFGNDRPSKTASRFWDYDALCYHDDWAWLMPVIEKIEGDFDGDSAVKFEVTRNVVHVTGKVVMGSEIKDYDWYGGMTSDSKIVSCWHGVVRFIIAYNRANATETKTIQQNVEETN